MRAPSPTPLLEARAITVRFGGLEAVGGLDMAIGRNAIHGLIGPNGAGKTTVLNVLTGFIRPSEGELVFDGEAIGGLGVNRFARRGLARTFQNIRLFGAMTVLESVLVGAHQRFFRQCALPRLRPARRARGGAGDDRARL
ncbi:ATP-binding cassette domain-containing protein [Ancylobacter dichloromethanicus]